MCSSVSREWWTSMTVGSDDAWWRVTNASTTGWRQDDDGMTTSSVCRHIAVKEFVWCHKVRFGTEPRLMTCHKVRFAMKSNLMTGDKAGCRRRAVVVSSSCRRRVVVVSSSCRRRAVVVPSSCRRRAVVVSSSCRRILPVTFLAPF